MMILFLVGYVACVAVAMLWARKKDRLTNVVAIWAILAAPFTLVWVMFALDISEAADQKRQTQYH